MSVLPSNLQPAPAEPDAPTESEPDAQRVRRWGMLAVLAGSAVVLALLVLLVVRLLLASAGPPLGVTALADLQPGACIAEDAVDLAEYTVVGCGTPHPQQVVAEVDLTLGRDAFTDYQSMAAVAQQTCERFLEYDLAVQQDPGVDRISMQAIGVPTQAEYEAGRTTALCTVVATDGSDLTTDECRPIS